jgi:hypothetical protein
MAGFVDTVEQSMLNHFLTDPAYAPPATMYLALSTTTPTEAGTGFTEPSTGAYARVATTATDWAAATGTAPATKTSSVAKTFPTATADWSAGAPMTYFGLFSAITAGSLLAFGVLTTPKPVLLGDTAAFAAGALVLKLGDPTDTF